MSNSLFAFAVLAGLLTMLPGLDTVQVLRSATIAGPRMAYQTVFGIIAGVFVLSIAAATGVSAVILASGYAYHLLKIIGGLYLLYLGIRMIIDARKITEEIDFNAEVKIDGFFKTFMRALTITVTNPKGLAFYIAVMPQFLPENSNTFVGGILLAAIHNTEVLIWFSLVIWSTALAKNYLNKPSAKRAMERISGVAMLAFGLSFIFNG